MCGMRCVDLNNDTLKILGTYTSLTTKNWNNNNNKKNCNRHLKHGTEETLTLEGKIVIFKTVAIWKIKKTVPKHIVSDLKKIQKAFLWKMSTPKKKNETLCNNYKAGGLKNLDIPNKIIAFKCS